MAELIQVGTVDTILGTAVSSSFLNDAKLEAYLSGLKLEASRLETLGSVSLSSFQSTGILCVISSKMDSFKREGGFGRYNITDCKGINGVVTIKNKENYPVFNNIESGSVILIERPNSLTYKDGNLFVGCQGGNQVHLMGKMMCFAHCGAKTKKGGSCRMAVDRSFDKFKRCYFHEPHSGYREPRPVPRVADEWDNRDAALNGTKGAGSQTSIQATMLKRSNIAVEPLLRCETIGRAVKQPLRDPFENDMIRMTKKQAAADAEKTQKVSHQNNQLDPTKGDSTYNNGKTAVQGKRKLLDGSTAVTSMSKNGMPQPPRKNARKTVPLSNVSQIGFEDEDGSDAFHDSTQKIDADIVKRDGNVSVPKENLHLFSRINQQYKEDLHQSSRMNAVLKPPSSQGGGPGVGNGNGGRRIMSMAGSCSSLGGSRAAGGASRQLSALSKKVNGNTKSLQAQIALKQSGGLGARSISKATLTNNKHKSIGAYRNVGGVVVDMKKLSANASRDRKAQQRAQMSHHEKQAEVEAKSAEDKEIEELLNRKSSHHDSVENEWMANFTAHLSKLEKVEYAVKKNNEVKKVTVNAYFCNTCRLYSETNPQLCRTKKHTVTFGQVVKRFFECKHCSKRMNTYSAMLPAKACTCGAFDWAACGSRGSQMRDKSTHNDDRLILAASEDASRGDKVLMNERVGNM